MLPETLVEGLGRLLENRNVTSLAGVHFDSNRPRSVSLLFLPVLICGYNLSGTGAHGEKGEGKESVIMP